MSTNVLLIGGGAREHAIAWKLRQSSRVDQIWIAPGNPGTAEAGKNLSLDLADFARVYATIQGQSIGLVVIGPEGPLAAGMVDFLAERDVPVFGPTQTAAQIESSKSFAKRLMAGAGIPTAAAAVFDDYEAAAAFVRAAQSVPIVKADGLAGGKGVTVPNDPQEALAALRDAMLGGVFGASGRTVVIEERLFGREVSAHAFADGTRTLAMPYACDHKAVYDGGRGPNTGGMGAYSPPGFVDERLHNTIWRQIVQPTVRALAERGTPYRGTIYPGLMITDAGPRVIEFNCRFGDPETQVILPRLLSDLFEPLWGAATGDLSNVQLAWSNEACVGVVLASEGYPGPIRDGAVIEGIDQVDADVQVFHAGTARDSQGRLVTAGGRVLTVVASGATIELARARAYANIERIRFAGMHYRSDIGLNAS